MSDCPKQLFKSLGLSDEVQDQVYGLLYTSGSDFDYATESEDDIELPNSSDIENYEKPTTNACTECNKDNCDCDDVFYKLQSQFEDLELNISTITADSALELLKEVTDEKIRKKIIDLTSTNY